MSPRNTLRQSLIEARRRIKLRCYTEKRMCVYCVFSARSFNRLTVLMEQKTDCGASPTSAGENQQKTTTTPNSCRPFTRSQTGYVPKRRRRDDSPPVVAPRRVASPPRKKRQRSVKTPSDELHADTPRESKSSDPPSRRSGSEVSTMHDHKSISPGNSAQLSFPPGSSSSTTSSIGDTNSDWRGSRPRGTLPIPIPNLTKKSRGRRVPTKLGGGNSTINDTDQTDTRMYVCKVESCRKCFHRGEHLKRHIRSIHTHEKREFEVFSTFSNPRLIHLSKNFSFRLPARKL